MEIKELNLTTRPLPLDVFKAIRFRNNYPERFTGHLIYLREYYNGYNVNTGDILDSEILKTVKNRFEDAFFVYSEELLFDQQLTDCLTWTRGGENKDIMFYFLPKTDYNNYIELSNKGALKSYYLPIKTTFWFDKNDPRINLIPNEVMVHVPLVELEKLIKTIKHV